MTGSETDVGGVRAIEVAGLRKTYGETVAVDGVSFAVAPGEIFGLIGPNGSGKTTTVECVQGLRRRDAGVVHVVGLDPETERAEVRRRIGSQLQESALPDRIRVWEVLDLFAALSPHAADWHLLMEQWGLADKRTATFASLSGGQRQRLFVALALVNRPEVVFLDEMTTGLDPAARRVAWSLVEALRDQGTTVVLVTHFMDEAERLCDRVGVLARGRLVALATPTALAGGAATTVVRFSADGDLHWLGDVAHVQRVNRTGRTVEVEGTGPVLALVAAALVQRGIVPDDLRAEHPSLEEAFLRLTGEHPE